MAKNPDGERAAVAEVGIATELPSFREALAVWGKIGVTSFGGPAGQIAMMHRVLVDEKKWLDERTYLLALNFCTLLPGPEAMQLATYSGWRLHGVKGGLAAGLLFVLPGALLILALAAVYVLFGDVPLMTALFTGVKAAVLAIVVEALLRIAKRSLKGRVQWAIAVLAFVAIFFFKVPFPLIVLAAGLAGYLLADAPRPADLAAIESSVPVRLSATVATAGLWLAIWLVPLALLTLALGSEHVLSHLAQFFSKLAVVTFGGAYAVLAYMAQDVVQVQGWLKPGEMLDALGLAETTPGPLILVTEFVGFLAAYRAEASNSLAMGAAGALVALWATFAPSFMFIFTGAPYIERLKSVPRLQAALSGITAAVVGIILNLSVWFALHVLFSSVADVQLGPLHLTVPDAATLQPVSAALALIAAVLLFALHQGVVTTLAMCAALSVAISYAGLFA